MCGGLNHIDDYDDEYKGLITLSSQTDRWLPQEVVAIEIAPNFEQVVVMLANTSLRHKNSKNSTASNFTIADIFIPVLVYNKR